MRVGDFIREIENIGLIDLDVIHLVGRAGINALVQDRGGGIGDAVVHTIGRVVKTIPEHLASDIGTAIPKQLEYRVRARCWGVEGGEIVFLDNQVTGPRRACGEDRVASNVVRVGIEIAGTSLVWPFPATAMVTC